MVTSSSSFSDIQNHWAKLFITHLSQRGIVTGYPNGTFRPDQSMTRAQFAAILSKAFPKPSQRRYTPFIDVTANYWAASAIKQAYEAGFVSGYPDNKFRPEEKITKANAIISIVAGLKLTTNITTDWKSVLEIYQDADTIPKYAADRIAIATLVEIVVNYPNLKILNPNQPATRAEVSAFIYQALVNLGQVPKIKSDYIVLSPLVTVSHPREFRASWVASVWNMDWPSKLGLTVEQQKAELLQIIERMQQLNFNALILQIRPEGDALYASKIEPWSSWLTGTQGKPPEPFYDPLEFAIAECHKRNIEVHAWFNPYRAKVSIKNAPNASNHISITNPEYVYQYGNQLWMEPGAKFIQDRVYQVILDVLQRYDIDGIHLDDYFYPYPIANQPFPDEKTYATYQQNGGKLTLGDWRRENVNQMVQRLSIGIKAAKPHVKFGISPFGIYRPGQPPQIRGLDAYNELYADSKKWLELGWVDYFSPQLYWRTNQPAQSYPVLLKWWTENNPKQRHIYPGNNLGQLDGVSWTIEEINKQVEITRSLSGQLSLGNIFFSISAFTKNRQAIYDIFKTSTYAQTALVPSMPWLSALAPETPKQLLVKNGQISWKAASNPNIRSWTLYKQNGDNWLLQKIIPVSTTTIAVEPGTYAICAVDKIANESVGAMVLVK